jgi:hypothetical protein
VARDTAGLRDFVVVAGLLRLAGAVVLGLSAWGRPDLTGLWPVAGADLLFGTAHLALSRTSGADPAHRP